MENNLKWEFVSTGGGPDDGVNNPMLQHFIGNYNYYLPREIIQNSLDARLDSSSPVRVSFNLEYFDKTNFPGYDSMIEVLNSCKNYYPVTDVQAQQFIDSAIRCLCSEEIPFLKVSDYNTKGLQGADDDKTGGWYNLVKSRGSSSKAAGEGGSFGIGKGAPFAASDLRVVFYSTKTNNDQTKFQGIAELISHEKGGDIKRGIGSYGFGQKSIENNIPEKFIRDEIGTDIFIAGYKNENNWNISLTKSILRNFWYAIYKADLIVNVEQVSISSENLEELLTQHFQGEPFKDYVKPTGNPLQYYLAVKNGRQFSKQIDLLGNVSFYFHETDEHLNYVAMLRKSHMIIYSRRFNFPGKFSGVFICDDIKGNEELRKMEPPAHDDWTPQRNSENGTKIMQEITAFIRNCLNQMKINNTGGIIDIPELHKYLPFDDGIENGEGKNRSVYTGNESEIETSRLIQKSGEHQQLASISPFKVSVINKPEAKSNSASGGDQGSGKGKNKTGNGTGKNGEPSNKPIRRDAVFSRAFVIKRNQSGFDYKVILKSKDSGKYNLIINAVGEEGSEEINITKVSDSKNTSYNFQLNKINGVNLENGETKEIIISIDSTFKNALKIDLYAI